MLSELGPGDFFGEMSLLESLPRDADATAMGETHLLVLNAGSLLVRLRRDPTFALEMLHRLSGRVRTLNADLEKALADREGRGNLVIIDAEEDRLFVISDLHLGNPSSTARSRLVEFLDYARITGTSICINGDGFEMLQTSFTRLASDAVPVLNALRRLMRDGNRVYYLVGNHDISLEHFLEDWLFTQIAPFLNLRSGDSLIRIEHGHLYDPWFVRNPRTYELGARPRGSRCSCIPTSTRPTRRSKCGRRRGTRATRPTKSAAGMLLSRGFDTVIFGHTHNPCDVELAEGQYVNSGNWLRGSSYVEIDQGKVELKKWETWGLGARA